MKRIVEIILVLIPVIGIAQNSDLDKGISKQKNGNYEEAKIYFEKVVDMDSSNHEAFFYLGISEFHLLNYDAAEDCFKVAISIEKNASDSYLWLGRTYTQKLQNASFYEQGILAGKALDNYKKAVNTDPSNVNARTSLANYYIHAPSIGGGSLSKAKEQVEEIEKYDPSQAVMLRAQIYSREEKYDLAIQEYTRFIENNSLDAQAYYQLGMLYQGIKRYDDAMESFDTALEIDEHAYGAMYQVGRTAVFSKENIKRGIECMKTFIRSDPGSAYPALDAAHWRLGMLYEIQGDPDRAKAEYKVASRLNPGEKKYQEALSKLQ